MATSTKTICKQVSLYAAFNVWMRRVGMYVRQLGSLVILCSIRRCTTAPLLSRGTLHLQQVYTQFDKHVFYYYSMNVWTFWSIVTMSIHLNWCYDKINVGLLEGYYGNMCLWDCQKVVTLRNLQYYHHLLWNYSFQWRYSLWLVLLDSFLGSKICQGVHHHS